MDSENKGYENCCKCFSSSPEDPWGGREYQSMWLNCMGRFPLDGSSPLTKGAAWFHDTSIDTPEWIKKKMKKGEMEEIKVSGCNKFRFYRLKKGVKN